MQWSATGRMARAAVTLAHRPLTSMARPICGFPYSAGPVSTCRFSATVGVAAEDEDLTFRVRLCHVQQHLARRLAGEEGQVVVGRGAAQIPSSLAEGRNMRGDEDLEILILLRRQAGESNILWVNKNPKVFGFSPTVMPLAGGGGGDRRRLAGCRIRCRFRSAEHSLGSSDSWLVLEQASCRCCQQSRKEIQLSRTASLFPEAFSIFNTRPLANGFHVEPRSTY
jgi:hypothetical protein